MPVDSLKRNFFIFDSHTYECTYRMMMPMAASLLEYFEPTVVNVYFVSRSIMT